MAISLSAAFEGFKNSPGWAKSLCMVFWGLIPILGTFIVMGYMPKYVSYRLKGETTKLPGLNDMGDLFVIGFKYCVGIFLCFLPLLIIFLIALAAMGQNYTSLGVIGVILILINALLVTVMTINFMTDFKISSFIDFSKGFAIINSNSGGFVKLVIALIVASAGASVLMILFGLIPIIGSIIGLYVSSIISLGVCSELIAQFEKETPMFMNYFKKANNLG